MADVHHVTCGGGLTSWCSLDPALMPAIDCGWATPLRASGTMRYFRSLFVRLVCGGCAALAAGAFALGWGDHQGSLARAETSVQDDAKHDALKQNFLAEHEIGRRFRIDPAGLPAPKTGPIVSNRALIVPYTGQAPQVPAGFTATPFATGLVHPRRLLVLPNGDVLVAEQSAGYLTLLRDDGSGHAAWIDRHVEDLNRPYGLAWQGDHVLVADQDGIWSVPHIIGALLLFFQCPTAPHSRAGTASPPRRPSRANRRHVNNWLADNPLRRAVTDTNRGPP
jgi:hypothetical protein